MNRYPCLSKLEAQGSAVVSPSTAGTLAKLDSENVRVEWAKAMGRLAEDPDGALTIARTLVESVCKHILDASGVEYTDAWDLPKLYNETAQRLNLGPSQHSEQAFKSILGGCASVVNGLANLRNRLGDAHGKGPVHIRPSPRHAELGVSVAGAMASFMVATWEHRRVAPGGI